MKLEDLKPNPQNPRTISVKKLEMLKKSYLKFGSLSGIIFNTITNRLVGGHQTSKTFLDANITITATYDPPTAKGTVAEGYALIDGERHPYRAVAWSEEVEKAANISANQHGGEFDLPILRDWILELDTQNIDLDLLGFDEKELADLMAPVETLPTAGEDDAPSVPKVSHVVPGDVFILGNHRLMCGDATMIGDVEQLMNGQKADMVFTDPPYGMNAVSKSGVLSANKKYDGDILNDDSTDVAKETYQVVSAMQITKMVFWGANYYASALPDASCWLVWDKNNGQSDQMDCELAWTNFKGVTRQFTQASEKTDRVHPTQKPVSLAEWCLKRWEAASVIDLFGGSGSTMIACEKMGIPCFVMELDPKYCSVILDRFEAFSNKKAIRESDGKLWSQIKQHDSIDISYKE